MPLHSSHLLQPLDVGYFAVLKRAYGDEIQEYMRRGVSHIDKPDFLTAFLAARNKSIAISTIRSGFKATGLCPYDLDQVLFKLNTQLRTPTPSPALPEFQHYWIPETPRNIDQLDRQASAIEASVQRRLEGFSSPTGQAFKQLVKGCQLAMHSAVLLADENKQLRAANERQKKKRATKRSYIAKGGVLTVQEGLNRAQLGETVVEGGSISEPVNLQTRAPRTCSLCRSLAHTARTCQLRLVSS
jgi:hypothetical protein